MNTKFNMKQLLSMGMVLLVISLGARCGGHSEDEMTRANAAARAEGEDMFFSMIFPDTSFDFLKGTEKIGVGMCDLITFKEVKESLIKCGKKQQEGKQQGSQEGIDEVLYAGDGGVLKSLVATIVESGKKCNYGLMSGNIRTKGSIDLNNILVANNGYSFMLNAFRKIITVNVFSKKNMKPEEIVPMLMRLFELIDSAGILEKIKKLEEVFEGIRELYKTYESKIESTMNSIHNISSIDNSNEGESGICSDKLNKYLPELQEILNKIKVANKAFTVAIKSFKEAADKFNKESKKYTDCSTSGEIKLHKWVFNGSELLCDKQHTVTLTRSLSLDGGFVKVENVKNFIESICIIKSVYEIYFGAINVHNKLINNFENKISEEIKELALYVNNITAHGGAAKPATSGTHSGRGREKKEKE